MGEIFNTDFELSFSKLFYTISCRITLMFGTLINAYAVVVGSLLGMVFKKIIPDNIKNRIFQGLGLVTLYLGVQMALKANEPLIMITSVLLGAIVGETLDVDKKMKEGAKLLESRVRSGDRLFVEGLVTAFLIFCMGAMTITGAIEEGVNNNSSIILAKSVLDFFTSISLATVFGLGVLCSAIPLLAFQGGITIIASYSGYLLDASVVTELSGVGGILLLGLGITMLEIKEVKVANLLPSLMIAPLLTIIF
jgi:uncharacterized membrane protein YqgA involved in biofilm formation